MPTPPQPDSNPRTDGGNPLGLIPAVPVAAWAAYASAVESGLAAYPTAAAAAPWVFDASLGAWIPAASVVSIANPPVGVVFAIGAVILVGSAVIWNTPNTSQPPLPTLYNAQWTKDSWDFYYKTYGKGRQAYDFAAGTLDLVKNWKPKPYDPTKPHKGGKGKGLGSMGFNNTGRRIIYISKNDPGEQFKTIGK